jgi:hypothetical protein
LKRLRKSGRTLTKSSVRLSQSQGQVHVWLCNQGKPLARTGVVNTKLVSDARRYGQDLVGELIDRTLREADRMSSRAEAD